MPRLLKDPSDLRRKNVMVSFSSREWKELQNLMDVTGITTAAVFLRASGLRTKLPRKIVLPELHIRLYKKLVQAADDMRQQNASLSISNSTFAEAMQSLKEIAEVLTDVNYYAKLVDERIKETLSHD